MWDFLFPPQTQQQSAQGPLGQISQEWSRFNNSPEGRLALAQFGLQMMQPIAPGQSIGSQIGQALGGAGQVLAQEQARQQQQARQTQQDTIAADERAYRRGQDQKSNARADRQLAAQIAAQQSSQAIAKRRLALEEQYPRGLSSLIGKRTTPDQLKAKASYIQKGLADYRANLAPGESATPELLQGVAQQLAQQWDQEQQAIAGAVGAPAAGGVVPYDKYVRKQ